MNNVAFMEERIDLHDTNCAHVNIAASMDSITMKSIAYTQNKFTVFVKITKRTIFFRSNFTRRNMFFYI